MATYERFNLKSLDDLRAKMAELGVDIPLQEDLTPLHRKVNVGAFQTPNALGIQPLEGVDIEHGIPSDLTFRRYERYARGGAGLIWIEATAVVPEGCGNGGAFYLNKTTAPGFSQLSERIYRANREEFGTVSRPLTIIQLTHAGRYARPGGESKPVIVYHCPALDKFHNLPADYPVISDDDLERLEDAFVSAAKLAYEAGIHGVDIKCSAGYLGTELLAGHTRPGRYGGSFENRTRFIRNVVDKIRSTVPHLLLTVRLSLYNGLDYPYSWGMSQTVAGQEDLSEPLQLARILYEQGVRLINVFTGSPYHTPWMSNPSDGVLPGHATPPEHPLESIDRLSRLAKDLHQAVPEMVVMGTGYSWLRQFFPFAAAGAIQDGRVQIAGLGREAYSYPGFARDLLEKGALDPRKVCLACSKCEQLIQTGNHVGCVVHDTEVYLPIYKALINSHQTGH